MTPIDETDERELNPDEESDGRATEGSDADAGFHDEARSWQDEVEFEGDASPQIADADLDPTLGYDLAETDGVEDRSLGPWLWALLAVVVLAVAGWWWWSNRNQPEAQVDAAPPPARETSQPRPAEPVQLPELDASDQFVRQLVSEVAAHPALTRWLASDALVRRFVGAVEVIASGGVPRDNLDFMSPDSGFQAEAAGPDSWRASASGHQRFDQLLQVMQLVDPADAARIVKTITPLTDEARRDLGYPEGDFRAALDRAVTHLVRVSPQLASEPLVREGELYLYQDATIEEGLSSAQKAFLRLGPEQAAWVRAWLQRFHNALVAS